MSGKVFEDIMLEQLYEYYELLRLLAPAQFSFRKGFSFSVSVIDSRLQEILKYRKNKCYFATFAKNYTENGDDNFNAVMLCDLS